jgi:hypothetical protein
LNQPNCHLVNHKQFASETRHFTIANAHDFRLNTDGCRQAGDIAGGRWHGNRVNWNVPQIQQKPKPAALYGQRTQDASNERTSDAAATS